MLKITNISDRTTLLISLPLISGEITLGDETDTEVSVQNITHDSGSVAWPVIRGKFKALVQLRDGENLLSFRHKNCQIHLTLFYKPLKNKRFIRLVYIKCKDNDGSFQAPDTEDNSSKSACRRISLAGQMLQTFTFDKIKDHNLKGKTFCLEEVNGQPICHNFISSLSLSEAFKLSGEELWSHFAVELMNSDLRVGKDCKFLAFLSFTRYENPCKVTPQNHQQVLHLTKGHVALGGGGLALFGTGCFHTWPQSLEEVPWRFGDQRKINRLCFMDDSANRGSHWACYATTLGATLHELGHTFDLGHTDCGIMGRGFDDINKYFIIDMFYFENEYQKKHNPFYQASSQLHCTVSLSSPSSFISPVTATLQSLKIKDSKHKDFQKADNRKRIMTPERPWKIPNPPDCYSDETAAVNIGKAYWTRSSALLLFYHKWFNEIYSEVEYPINKCGLVLHSSDDIRVIEFRDGDGTAFHHLEFPEKTESVDLSQFDIHSAAPSDSDVLSFVAETSSGQLLKSEFSKSELL